jgi:hypothetical protein
MFIGDPEGLTKDGQLFGRVRPVELNLHDAAGAPAAKHIGREPLAQRGRAANTGGAEECGLGG